ncbi:hypothetical protein ONS95_009469 [Cadophora gregata]|uniref:uncharacterized protein n=1 Tax=Cadophora gregata TaxID=51156 RepID=UPI0026DD5E10|nr:uncharacterized protein ONS95_009469 [Cadophora gregata]KAK0124520.1 hypothetical protein ONS95_009469 [Cadophora gregata]
MADWLRPVFGRRAQSSSVGERPSSFSVDESVVDSEDGNVSTPIPRLRPTSRVSSYIGMRPPTPPIPQTPDTYFSLKDPESIYHEPSRDQMAEMLKVVMMNQSSTTSVPVEYNSCILHVLEAYNELRIELRLREETIEELKHTHTKDIKDFEMLATQWETKEKDYKAEMKKLEILLSKTDGGLEQVSLARSKSTVHGAQRVGDSIRRDIGTIKARHVARSSREHSSTNGDAPIDASTSHRYRADRYFKTRIKTDPQDPSTVDKEREPPSRILQPRASTGTLQLYASPAQMEEPTGQNQSETIDLAALTNHQLKVSEKQRAQEEFGVDFGSSTESESSTNTHNETFSPRALSKGLGVGLRKPQLDLPTRKLPKKPSTLSLNESYASHYDILSNESPQQMGFSFRPGDDAETLAQRMRTGQIPRRPMNYARPQSRKDNSLEAEDDELAQSRRLELSPYSKIDPRTGAGLPHRPSLKSLPRPRDLQDSDGLKRDDSSGSFVTALRDNSGRSSANGSQNNSQRRKRLDRSTGSSEAVSAATKAFGNAAGAKRPSLQRKSGSEPVDGGSTDGNFSRTK